MATDDTHTKPTEAYEVIRATQRPLESVEVGGKTLKFRGNGMMRIKDRGLAMAVREKLGKEVTVTKVNYPSAHDQGHRYFFGSLPEMPWKKKKVEQPEEEPAKEEEDGRKDSTRSAEG